VILSIWTNWLLYWKWSVSVTSNTPLRYLWKTITLVLKVSTTIITSIAALPSRLAVMLSIIYVATFIAAVILYLSKGVRDWTIKFLIPAILIRPFGFLATNHVLIIWLFRLLTLSVFDEGHIRNNVESGDLKIVKWWKNPITIVCLSFCPFSFVYCVFCPSSIYRFWLTLWLNSSSWTWPLLHLFVFPSV
jgi:hypothetical protein